MKKVIFMSIALSILAIMSTGCNFNGRHQEIQNETVEDTVVVEVTETEETTDTVISWTDSLVSGQDTVTE